MNNNRNIKKTEIINEGTLLIGGMNAHVPKGTPLIVHGEKYTLATAADEVQKRIDLAQDAVSSYAKHVESLQKLEAEIERSNPFIASLKATFYAMFATSPATLADFGLTQKKARRALTAEEKFQRAVNAKATRAARHTMGSRQKAAIVGKGGVVGVQPPPTATSVEAAGASPANAAPVTAATPAPAPATSKGNVPAVTQVVAAAPSPSPSPSPIANVVPSPVASGSSGSSNGASAGAGPTNGALNGAASGSTG